MTGCGATTERVMPPTPAVPEPAITQSRAIIEAIEPEVDGGRFAAKRSIGETIRVAADVFIDGHDKVSAAVLHRVADADDEWHETDMSPLINDRWTGEFAVDVVGYHEFTIVAWHDRFATWQYDFRKRVAAGQDVGIDLLIGADLVAEAADANDGDVGASLGGFAMLMRRKDARAQAIEVALGAALAQYMRRHAPRPHTTTWARPARIWVDRERARFSSWYEFFPRSASNDLARHGTLKDVEAQLDRVARLGFDVLYLPPIHPIGRAFRKGKNNSTTAAEGDVGSPWAIGGPEGGHDAVHPELGTVADVERLIAAARGKGIDVALDLAYQCSPDHPYVKQHPEWFKHRPDGTIQYAENPPKKYQDIYPFDFECAEYQALWDELLRVALFWVDKGVRIFRVDNPHTKPFPFWEWLIANIKQREPDVLFLSEAFTRPKVMYRLAKAGFTQSYTYFTWRKRSVELQGVLQRTDDLARRRLLPSECLAEHAGHPAGVSADRRAVCLHRPRRTGRDGVCELGRVRPGVRVDGQSSARARPRGVRRQREVPTPPVEPRQRTLALGPVGPAQPRAQSAPGAATRSRADVSSQR